MNTQKTLTALVVHTALMLSLSFIHVTPASAFTCLLDTNNDGNADTNVDTDGGADSNGLNTELACGGGANATGLDSTALGLNSDATADNATAMGAFADATAERSTALGYNADASGVNATVVGADTDATARDSTAVGRIAQAESVGAIALGASADISATDSSSAIALGYLSRVGAGAPGAIAIGGDRDGDTIGAQALAPNSIALGADVVADKADTLFVGVPVRVVPPSVGVVEKVLMRLENNGGVNFKLNDTSAGDGEWTFRTGTQGSKFVIGKTGSGVQEFQVFSGGNVSIAGTLSQGSSRTHKENIEAINHKAILDKVANLPIREWNYIHDADHIKHIGPMAEDVHALFEVGQGPKSLSTLDTSGIALAAIQALSHELKQTQQDMDKKNQQVQAIQQRLVEKDNEVQTLRQQLQEKDAELVQLKQHLTALEEQQHRVIQTVARLLEQHSQPITTATFLQ